MRPSASEPTAFDQLHPEIRRWIREQGWSELREVQEKAVRALLTAETDVLISASTAAGKTEAAFLPVLTRVAGAGASSVSVLYVSPLKALINDQHRRLELLADRMDLPVVRWHGDAAQGPKQRLLRRPSGVVLITPESIEALLVRRPADAARLFAGLQFVIVDELHAFLRGPRGLQLGSLLRRLDALIGRRARRVGLSATLGDLKVARRWLNFQAADSVQEIVAQGSPELQLQIRGYEDPPGDDAPDELESGEGEPKSLDHIADHMFRTLRGSNNLVFGGSRRTVEAIADRLRLRSERANVPNEFLPHHGSLSKEFREGLELRLKDGALPTTAIATTTLELGVDIGSVASVAQVGAPRSISSLKQRLGRSGRREGVPAVLRLYVREKHLAADADPLDHLRSNVARAVASIQLLAGKFIETPSEDAALATAVLHQTLALLTQQGGLRPEVAYRSLCVGGPFSACEPGDYVDLLRGMAATVPPLLEQSPDGTLLLGPLGEQIANGREFYALFETDQEWRLVHGARTLGVVPLSNLLGVGSLIGFAGQRWRVVTVDDRAKVLEVTPHRSGRLPKFDRLYGEPIHDRLAAETREVLKFDDEPPYLDVGARRLLREGREAFHRFDMGRKRFIRSGRDTHLLTWRGSLVNGYMAVALMAVGLDCEAHDLGVTIASCSPSEARSIVEQLSRPPSVEDLAAFVQNLQTAKYDDFVPEHLLRRLWSKANMHLERELPALVEELLAGDPV